MNAPRRGVAVGSLGTPLGVLGVTVSARGVTGCGEAAEPDRGASPLLDQALRELGEYFAGARRGFDVPLDLSACSVFARRVYDLTRAVPYGETRSYGDIAAVLGSSARAVGSALARLPVGILVPAHRVTLANGGLGGYQGRGDVKAWLLDFEAEQAHLDRRGPVRS
ncbi:MAG TPA: methylated-DNA--[protein]-cysteine S-methyltransferase [Deinococcales bacterium]|nr:methylated-DNA--[protein]-cysteine S-methyltransferase [Deinococcales bacterium]